MSQTMQEQVRVEFTIQVAESADRVAVLGAADRNLKLVREALGVHVTARDSTVKISGETRAVAAARQVLERLDDAAQRGAPLGGREVLDTIAQAVGFVEEHGEAFEGIASRQTVGARETTELDVYVRGRRVVGSSDNQRAYLEAMRTHDMVFGIGPAGTGKTYLAVAWAVHMLKVGLVRKVILVRPAVEAGEKLGFLPGDMEAKVNPYLRPLLDALHDMMDYATIKRFMLSDVVEVVPLAFMRGRTLNDAAIILDEAQNTTKGQMQMFLTRMGQRSKMVITGDTTQIDLPDPHESGLVDAARRLQQVDGIAFAGLDRTDIVRHNLVQRVVEAYTPLSQDAQNADAKSMKEPEVGDGQGHL